MKLKILDPPNRIEIESCTTDELDKLIEISTAKRWSWQTKKYYEISYMSMFRFLPTGLYKRILGLGKSGWNVDLVGLDKIISDVTNEELDEWIANEELKYAPRWYQFESFYKALKYRRSKFEIATSGGKSFIIAMITRWLLENEIPEGGQIMIVTIRQMLVDQMIDDIYSYKKDNLIRYQAVYAGTEKIENPNVIVGTYQSLSTWDKENFANIHTIIVDECHSAKIASIKDNILPKLNPNICKRYLAFTGTMPDNDVDNLHLEAYFGPTVLKLTANELQEEGSIAKIKIKMIKMLYSLEQSKSYFFDEDVKTGGPTRLRAERAWIHSNPERNKFIKDICARFVGNIVILVESVDYAKFLVEWLGTIEEKKVHLIYGGTKRNDRNEIKEELKLDEDNHILVATYETMSTGVSINNIMAVMFPDGGKSRIRIRQSLGRGLRLHPKKDHLVVFDFWDKLNKRYEKKDENGNVVVEGWPGPNSNIFDSHARIRKQIYENEKFPYNVTEYVVK